MKPHVIIYSRPGCHLCDEAKQAIEEAGCETDYTLEIVNIESDRDLLDKYSYDIPVITIDGVKIFEHSVDSKQFRKALQKKSAKPAR